MAPAELTCMLHVGEHVLHIIRGQLRQPLATQARLKPHLYPQQVCGAGSRSKHLQESGSYLCMQYCVRTQYCQIFYLWYVHHHL